MVTRPLSAEWLYVPLHLCRAVSAVVSEPCTRACHYVRAPLHVMLPSFSMQRTSVTRRANMTVHSLDGENISLRYGPLMRYNLLGQGWTSLIRQDPGNIPQTFWCTLTWWHHSVGAHLSATHPWWKCPSLTTSRGALLDWDLVPVEDLKITNNQNNQRMGTQPFLCSHCQFIWKRTLPLSGWLQLHWGLSSFFCLHYSNNTAPTFQRNVERHLSKTST